MGNRVLWEIPPRYKRALLNEFCKLTQIRSTKMYRVCQYFQHYGIRANHRRLAAEMWERYAGLAPDDLAADLSWYEFEQDSLE